MGWGTGPWGTSAWGIGGLLNGATMLQLLAATPLRENVVQLEFNGAVYFSGLLDPSDASNRKRFSIVPVQGSRDEDGDPARPVFAAIISQGGAGGSLLNVATDRPFSSWPAKYSISANQIRAVNGALLDLTRTSVTFDGVQYDEAGGANRPVVSSADFANPQTVSGLAVGISPAQSAILGSYPIGPDGDYATDQGLVSWKKRIFRRLLARKGGFAALSAIYGLGAQERLKQPFSGTLGTQLSADAKVQVLADPETASADVTFVQNPEAPQIGYFTIVAMHVSGQGMNETLPMAIGG